MENEMTVSKGNALPVKAKLANGTTIFAQAQLIGGQVQLLNQSAPASDVIEVFYLYADVDKDTYLLERLETHLAIMRARV